MTTPTSTDDEGVHRAEESDQVQYQYLYGHGRMPLFMKLLWLGFLVFGAWYTTTYLLTALQGEVG